MGYKREKKIFGKGQRVVLDAFTGDGEDSNIRFEVVDYRYSLSPWKNKRSIEFFNSGRYIYSTVYLSSHRHFQPLYPQAQRAADAFFRQRKPKTALVLGCAGCSIPRFVVNHYKGCTVTGVEYSKQFVDIAQRYFISSKMRSRFKLLHDDAFSYVANAQNKEKFDYIHTDIYIGDRIHPDVFKSDFISGIYNILSDEGLALFNAFHVPPDQLRSIAEHISAPFRAVYVLDMYRKYFVALIKTNHKSRLSEFEKQITRSMTIEQKIIK